MNLSHPRWCDRLNCTAMGDTGEHRGQLHVVDGVGGFATRVTAFLSATASTPHEIMVDTTVGNGWLFLAEARELALHLAALCVEADESMYAVATTPS